MIKPVGYGQPLRFGNQADSGASKPESKPFESGQLMRTLMDDVESILWGEERMMTVPALRKRLEGRDPNKPYAQGLQRIIDEKEGKNGP